MEAAASEPGGAFSFDNLSSVSSNRLPNPPSFSSESSTPPPRFDDSLSFSGSKRWRTAAGVSGGGGGGGRGDGGGVKPLFADESDLNYSGDSDGEYETFIQKMNPPRVVVDNEACNNATVIQVDSAKKYGILLKVVQVLTDLNLIIRKAYMSSDGGWCMEVLNVTDHEGQKLKDKSTINGLVDHIHKSLGAHSRYSPSWRRSMDVVPSFDHTLIELTGTDRPGLLSEVSAVLTNFKCNVVNAKLWTHNARAACVMCITDMDTGLAISDERLSRIKEALCSEGTRMVAPRVVIHTERRLHQMLFAGGDYKGCNVDRSDQILWPVVTFENLYDKDYSVVTIRCKDSPKLIFDTVCTLTDMLYIVFHGSVVTEGPEAYQEYYLRHIDEFPVYSEAEKVHVIQCLVAAIERRVTEGLKLELCTYDKVGLLSDVTRTFHVYGLTVTRAEITTRGAKAIDTFYVRSATGNPVEAATIDTIRQRIGMSCLQVEGQCELPKAPAQESSTGFRLNGLPRSRSLSSFG